MALKGQAGFTLIETIVVLFIASLLVGMVGAWAQQYSEHQLVTMVSEHQKAVAGATSHFIRDNYPAVLNRANAGPLTLGINELIAQGLLPTGFSPTNAFEQHYRIIVIKPQANQLKTMIVTDNGEVIEERILRKIVRHLGASGGRISNLDAEGKPNAALVGVVQGADEGWTESLSPYGVSPGVGHLASAIFHQDGQEVENYLHRKAIPGKPELNRMQTHLDMGGNDINGANAIKGQSAELTGWLTAEGAELRGALKAKEAKLSELTTNSATVHGSARVHGRLSTGDFAQIDGTAVEGGACPGGNIIAVDANTKLALSCQSGVWKKQWGTASQQVFATSDSCSSYAPPNNGPWSIAFCPAGYTVTGGGYQITLWNPAQDSAQSNAPDVSSPYGANGWGVVAGANTGNSCFRAFAVCIR